MDKKPWPKYRRKQLAQFQTLLHEASMIDNGSSALRRIALVIRLARQLMKSAYRRRHIESFLQFLIAEAAGQK
jgi:Mg-chelatase subunit ChlD